MLCWKWLSMVGMIEQEIYLKESLLPLHSNFINTAARNPILYCSL